jgi:hypothetical protein
MKHAPEEESVHLVDHLARNIKTGRFERSDSWEMSFLSVSCQTVKRRGGGRGPGSTCGKGP